MLHEIDAHLEAHPIHQESKFEHLLKAVLPIFNFVVPMLFFKPGWQSYLRAFIAAATEVATQPVQSLETDPNSPPPPGGPGGL